VNTREFLKEKRNFKLMMEDEPKSEIREGQVLIRVYVGGQESPQVGPFVSIGHLFGQLLGKPVKQEFIFGADI
jgi:hypothetical protein